MISNYCVKSLKVIWKNKISFVHMFVNTTQVKKLEEIRANKECQQLMFASLSHDMRTTLNAFINSLQLIRMSFEELKKSFEDYPNIKNSYHVLEPNFFKYFRIGEISSCLLLSLVEDILDMAKFSSNSFKLNIEEFNLKAVLKEIEFIFEFQCTEKKLRFAIDCRREISKDFFNSDPKRLKQVLINLVSNSLKFTERGSITIIVSKFVKHSETFLKFKVIDTGIGINKNDIPKLFNQFKMIDKHRKKFNKSGSGLGLSISKKIVESLGGKISVKSEEGRQTVFKFTIKCIESDQINNEESKRNNIIEEIKESHIHIEHLNSDEQLPKCNEEFQNITYRRQELIQNSKVKSNKIMASRLIFKNIKEKED